MCFSLSLLVAEAEAARQALVPRRLLNRGLGIDRGLLQFRFLMQGGDIVQNLLHRLRADHRQHPIKNGGDAVGRRILRRRQCAVRIGLERGQFARLPSRRFGGSGFFNRNCRPLIKRQTPGRHRQIASPEKAPSRPPLLGITAMIHGSAIFLHVSSPTDRLSRRLSAPYSGAPLPLIQGRCESARTAGSGRVVNDQTFPLPLIANIPV